MIEIVLGDLSLEEHAQAVISLLDDYARDIMGGGRIFRSTHGKT